MSLLVVFPRKAVSFASQFALIAGKKMRRFSLTPGDTDRKPPTHQHQINLNGNAAIKSKARQQELLLPPRLPRDTPPLPHGRISPVKERFHRFETIKVY